LNAPHRLAHDPTLIRNADDGDGDALALLAIAVLRLGDRAAAGARFEVCASMTHATGLHGLAALAEADDPDGSWDLMHRALALGAPASLARIARIVRLRGEEGFSDELMLSAARLGEADAMYDVAHRATERGDDDLSRQWYATAVEREAGLEWPVERGVGYWLL
jgi:hypothetical protein